MSELKRKFRDLKTWATEVNKKPNVLDRLRHSGVDLLLAVAGFQVGSLSIEKAIEYNKGAGNLLDQSGEILETVGEMMTSGQIETVMTLQENARNLMAMGDVLHGLSWAAVGVGLIAGIQLTYNGIMVGIETVQDIRRSQ